MPAMIEETEESVEEHILGALEKISSQSHEEIFNSVVRINKSVVVQGLSVTKGIMIKSILQQRSLSMSFDLFECDPVPYQIFILEPANTAIKRCWQFCIHRKIDVLLIGGHVSAVAACKGPCGICHREVFVAQHSSGQPAPLPRLRLDCRGLNRGPNKEYLVVVPEPIPVKPMDRPRSW